MSEKILIVGGDPNSINSEIIYKTWVNLDKNVKKNIFLIASYELILKQVKKLHLTNVFEKVHSLKSFNNSNKLKIIDIPLDFKNPFDVSLNSSSKYVIKCLNLAHKLASTKNVKGIINCPINKILIKSTNMIGVTEFLAAKSNIKDQSEVMMIHNRKLSVVPLTTHINIKDVAKKIKLKMIVKKVLTLNKSYKKIFKKKPFIGVLGLNPHNSELVNSSEEIREIIPSINILKKKGLNIRGPLVADTVFVDEYKRYDVIVGMYHDQVLSPFKTLFHFDGINITLGLNYTRVSPDHGPASELIGKNKADFKSLFNCVKFISNL